MVWNANLFGRSAQGSERRQWETLPCFRNRFSLCPPKFLDQLKLASTRRSSWPTASQPTRGTRFSEINRTSHVVWNDARMITTIGSLLYACIKQVLCPLALAANVLCREFSVWCGLSSETIHPSLCSVCVCVHSGVCACYSIELISVLSIDLTETVCPCKLLPDLKLCVPRFFRRWELFV
jgi:hypothetical protein